MAKSTTFVHDRITKILETNADGTKQFGLRDKFAKNCESLGEAGGRSWLLRHIEVTEIFRKLLASDDWAAADTETTTVGASAEVIELAVVEPARCECNYESRRTQADPEACDCGVAFHALWKTRRPITKGSQAVHGISNEQLLDAPTLADDYDKLCGVLNKYKRLIWYNAAFDLRVIEQSTFEQGLDDLPLPETYDVMTEIGDWIGDWNPKQNGWRWPKLEGGHRATGDCQELIRAIRRTQETDIEYARSLLET